MHCCVSTAQLLRERATILRCTYIAYLLVVTSVRVLKITLLEI
jgi:hypothetical protein